MKTIDDIRNAVASALAQTVGDVDAAAIDLSQTLENIGVDSLSFLRLNMTLEQALGISLPTISASWWRPGKKSSHTWTTP